MRVLHVIDALGLGGGAEHSLATMLPLLRDRGIESSVVCLLPREGGLQTRLQEQGFTVRILPTTSRLGRVHALRRRIITESPDIVHATLYNSCVATRLACVGLKVARVDSLVNTSYDPVRTQTLKIRWWKLRSARALDGWTARHLGGHFHAITQAVADEAVHVLGIASDRITVIPRGRSSVDLGERTEARRRNSRHRLRIDDNALVVLNVGRQDRQKAQADLIRAFAKVHEIIPHTVLLLAGREGDASAEVRLALAETMLADDAVRLLGHRTDVLDLYVASDVFVFPSLYEGLGCALIEAQGLGVPVIGSDAPAIAEVLGNGEYGVIVPREDNSALSRAMTELLSQPERRAHLALEGRERFAEKYESNKVAEAMVDMYERILSTNPWSDRCSSDDN